MIFTSGEAVFASPDAPVDFPYCFIYREGRQGGAAGGGARGGDFIHIRPLTFVQVIHRVIHRGEI